MGKNVFRKQNRPAAHSSDMPAPHPVIAEHQDRAPRWGWLLLSAPGRLLVVDSPLPAAEVERRLRQQGAIVHFTAAHRITVHLPPSRTQRQFFATIESNPALINGSRIIGQTRTPFRTVLIRVALSVTLFWLALFWIIAAHVWLGVLFALGCIGFLLLAQYERLTGRDRWLYSDWLRRIVASEIADRQ